MQFSSAQEFFNKLHNLLYLIVILPLLVFAFLYLDLRSEDVLANQFFSPVWYVVILTTYAATVGLTFWIYNRRLQEIRQDNVFEKKIAAFARLTIVRYLILSLVGLLIAGGLFVSHDQVFVILFVASLIVISFIWPSARRVAKDLKLKDVERDRIMGREPK